MAVRESEPNMTRENLTKKSSKTTKQVLVVAHELKLARQLAGNVKGERDRALKNLRTWFKQRAAKTPFSEEDFQRLWKGLFYSMWMSDKPLIQEECAENIAALIHSVPTEATGIFFKAGLTILSNEWFGIDQLRLNKFLMFVRRFLRQTFVCLKNQNWSSASVQEFNQVLNDTIFSGSSAPRKGLLLHFIDIFLEELAKVADGELPSNLTSEFLEPFAKFLAYNDDIRIVNHIRKHIYEQLMEQSDVGLEYKDKYQTWKQLGFPGRINQLIKVDDHGEEIEEEDSETVKEEKILDPRAGRVDVSIPQIKFKSNLIIKTLKQYKIDSKTNMKTRKTITELIKQFVTLSRGVYPLGAIKVDKPDPSDHFDVRKAAKDLIKFDNKIKGKNKKRKNDDDDLTELRNGKKIKLETDLKKILSQELQDIYEKSPRMKLKKKNSNDILKHDFIGKLKRPNSDQSEGPKIKIHKIERPPQELEAIFKRNSGTWFVFKKPKKAQGKLEKLINDWEVQESAREAPEKTPEKTPPPQTVEQSIEVSPKRSPRKSIKTEELITPRQTIPRRVKLITPTKSAKRVKINTKLNSSQEVQDHIALISSSPQIPYNANARPSKPLLKTPAVPSPINPFYFSK